jgi:mono/diheme cytochrome c family protein
MYTLIKLALIASPMLVATSSLAATPDTGKQLYSQNCLVCHGMRGKGNGPSGRGLDPKPTNFTTATPDEKQWFTATKLGTKAIGKSKGMEAFGTKLTDEQIKEVLTYVKTFKNP